MNFISAFYKYYLLYKYSGLSSYHLDLQSSKFQLKRKDQIINLIILSAISAAFLGSSSACKTRKVSVNIIFNYLFVFIQFVGTLLSMLWCRKKSMAVTKLCKMITLVDASLVKINLRKINQKPNTFVSWNLFVNYFIVLLNVSGDVAWFVFSVNVAEKKLNLDNIVCTLSYCVPAIIFTNTTCIYTFLITECVRRLRFVNDTLKSIQRRKYNTLLLFSRKHFLYKLKEIHSVLSVLLKSLHTVHRIFLMQILMKFAWLFMSAISNTFYLANYYLSKKENIAESDLIVIFGFSAFGALFIYNCLLDIYLYTSSESVVSS